MAITSPNPNHSCTFAHEEPSLAKIPCASKLPLVPLYSFELQDCKEEISIDFSRNWAAEHPKDPKRLQWEHDTIAEILTSPRRDRGGKAGLRCILHAPKSPRWPRAPPTRRGEETGERRPLRQSGWFLRRGRAGCGHAVDISGGDIPRAVVRAHMSVRSGGQRAPPPPPPPRFDTTCCFFFCYFICLQLVLC